MGGRHEKEQMLLYPIADAMQMELMLHVRKDKPLRVRGDMGMGLPITKGVKLDLNCKVHASLVNQKEAWVLIRVKGDLWVFVSYLIATKEVYFWIVDGAAVKLTEDSAKSYDGSSFDSMLTSLARGCVAVFKRSKINNGTKGKWERIDYASSMDEGSLSHLKEEAESDSKELGGTAPSTGSSPS